MNHLTEYIADCDGVEFYVAYCSCVQCCCCCCCRCGT